MFPRPRSAVFALGLLLATACSVPVPAAAPTPTPALVHIKVGDQMFAPLAPVYVAFDRGYFKEQGLDVELVPMPDPTQVVTLLSTGELTFGCIGPDPALFNAMARGINVRLLAAEVNNGPNDRPAAFIMRPDLLDSGRYKNPSDLKGMTFAVPGPQGKFYINRLLVQGGLTDNDVTYVQLSLPDMLPALQNKAVDGAWEVEPLVSLAQKQGFARTVATTGALFPNAIAQALAVNPNFGAANPDAAQRFVAAYVRGLRDYYHAFVKRDTDRSTVVQAMINHTPVKDAALYDVIGMQSVDPNAAMDPSSWDTYQGYFVANGTVQQKVDINSYIDSSYLNAALDRVGREP
jgi:NitT/TauT family transport system substrate-binding protein